MKLLYRSVLGFSCLVSLAQMAMADDPLLDPAPAVAVSADSEARGVLRARDQAMLASELSGRIVELPFSEGESFKKGDTLARFDCSAYQAQLNAARPPAVVPAKNWRTTNNWRRSIRSAGLKWLAPSQTHRNPGPVPGLSGAGQALQRAGAV
jgi:hypothetical protein